MNEKELEALIKDILTLAHLEESRCDESEHKWWIRTILQDLPDCDGGIVVELGAYAGAGSTSLGLAAKERGWKILSVDLWKSNDELLFEDEEGGKLLLRYLRQIRRVGLRDHSLQMISDTRQAARDWFSPIPFLHIDACHEWPTPMEDFRLWSPSVIPGGIVAFHDAVDSDIPRCLEELKLAGDLDEWDEIGGLPELAYRPGPFWDIGWRTRAFRRKQ